MRWPENGNAALGVLHHSHATQNERAHDDLGDVGLRCDHAPKIRALHADDVRRQVLLHRARIDQDLAVVEEIELARKFIRPVRDEDVLTTGFILFPHLDRALIAHNEEVDASVATFEEHRLRRDDLFRSESTNATDLFIGKPRKRLRETLIRVGRIVQHRG